MGTRRNLNRDKLDFKNGKIPQLFRRLFFPTLVAMIFTSALTAIDGIFVGHGVGADGLASVNIVSPMYMVSTGIGLMFGVGASVIASIRLSEENIKGARIILSQSFIVGTVCMALICTICLILPHGIVRMLGASDGLAPSSIDYMLWMLPGILFLCVQYIGMMLIRLDGSPKYAMWIQVVAAILNIGLDWYLIFPLGMGVLGASVATSIANIVGGTMAIIYFAFLGNKLRFYKLKFSVTSLLLTLRNTAYIMKLGFSTLLTEFAIGVMMLTGNHLFMKELGENGVAAFAVVCYLFPMVFSIGNAIAQSAQPIMSFNYGAKRFDRVETSLSVSLITAILTGLIITVGLIFGAPDITGLFLEKGGQAYDLAVKGLPYFAPAALFFSINIAFIGFYQSIEKVRLSIIYTSLRGVIFLVPCFIILPHIIGVYGLWTAIPGAELLTCGIIIPCYMRSKKYTNSH